MKNISKNPINICQFHEKHGWQEGDGKDGVWGGGGWGGLNHACFSSEVFEPVPNNETFKILQEYAVFGEFYPF